VKHFHKPLYLKKNLILDPAPFSPWARRETNFVDRLIEARIASHYSSDGLSSLGAAAQYRCSSFRILGVWDLKISSSIKTKNFFLSSISRIQNSHMPTYVIFLHLLWHRWLLNLVLYCFHVLKTVLNHSLICTTIAERRSWIHTKMQVGWLHYVATVLWWTQPHWHLSSSTSHALMEGNLRYYPSQNFTSYFERCVKLHLSREILVSVCRSLLSGMWLSVG
jgi:hypothetical protein